MDRPNRKRLLQIGAILIVASLVLFALSVYIIDSNAVSKKNITIGPGSTYTLVKGHVSAGDDIDYSIASPTGLNATSISSYLSFDTGDTAGYVNATNTSSITNVVVSPYTGNVSLVITNNGPSTIVVDASVGIVDYVSLMTIVFGIALLPSGFALAGIYYYSRHVERKKEKLLRGFK